MPRGDKCWSDWATRLRISMMQARVVEVTKTVAEIAAETGTDETIENLSSFGVWNAVRQARPDWDTIPRRGLDVDFETNADGKVEQVTFRLNATWRGILGAAARRAAE